MGYSSQSSCFRLNIPPEKKKGESSKTKKKESIAIQVAGQEKPNAPAQKNENGDEKKQAKKISLKERLSKVGNFDESKVALTC